MKVKKITNSGIIILTLDYALFEEVLLKLNVECISVFLRVFKKMMHLISIPSNLLKNHLQDNDLLSIDRKYVLQMIKLRSDYYRNEEVKELYQQLASMLIVCFTSLLKFGTIAGSLSFFKRRVLGILVEKWSSFLWLVFNVLLICKSYLLN